MYKVLGQFDLRCVKDWMSLLDTLIPERLYRFKVVRNCTEDLYFE